MARSVPHEACFFCNQAPCQCNVKPQVAKKQAAKKSKPVKTVEAPVLAEPSPTPKREFKRRASVPDESMRIAVRNCVPILHPDEIAAHADIIEPPADVRARVDQWKERNGIGME